MRGQRISVGPGNSWQQCEAVLVRHVCRRCRGYVSGEIFANETDYDNSDDDIDHAVKKTLFHAEDVLSALDKQTRKKMLPLSSDDSEPDEGKLPPALYQRPSKKVASKPPAIGPPQKLSKSLQRRRGKKASATIPCQRLSSNKTPS